MVKCASDFNLPITMRLLLFPLPSFSVRAFVFALGALWTPLARAEESAPGGGLAVNIIMLVLIVAAFYFILIRPQQKRAKQHREMLSALATDDEVVTVGGVIGRVDKITENYVVLEVGENQRMRFQKQAIQTLLPRGTIKNL